jgi:hypothetical protein
MKSHLLPFSAFDPLTLCVEKTLKTLGKLQGTGELEYQGRGPGAVWRKKWNSPNGWPDRGVLGLIDYEGKLLLSRYSL